MLTMDMLDNTRVSYPYKRKVFHQLKDFIDTNVLNIAYLVGPRRCGKTVILHQLEQLYGSRARYVNFKQGSDNSVIYDILRDAIDGKDTIYLLDEVTSLEYFDTELCELDRDLANVKVILTGSQSYVLSKVCSINFASLAKKYTIGFLSFDEYLEYTQKLVPNTSEIDKLMNYVTEDDYLDYVLGQYKFKQVLSDSREYLQGCIDDLIELNVKARRRTYAIPTDDFSLDMILKVIYAILFKGKNSELLSETLEHYYHSTSKMSLREFTAIIRFLLECDLIIVTSKYDSRFNDRLFIQELYIKDFCKLQVDDFLTEYDITFKYPMFLVTVLEDLANSLSMDCRELIKGSLLGSILECDIKSSLSYIRDTSYLEKLVQEDTGFEVDYYNDMSGVAVEMTIANKPLAKVHFEDFKEYSMCKKILLTKDINDEVQDIRRLPYYIFAFILGRGI